MSLRLPCNKFFWLVECPVRAAAPLLRGQAQQFANPAAAATPRRHLLALGRASWSLQAKRGQMGRRIDESVAYKEATAALEAAALLPSLIVFDLDYTAWPCEMYDESDTPRLFPETRSILEACRDKQITMAVASRTPTPKVASAFLHKLGIYDMFADVQMIPYTQKDTTHFPKIKSALGIPYHKMLFFDDENGNITRVSRLGVTSVLVSTASGVNVDAFRKGLRQFQNSRQQ